MIRIVSLALLAILSLPLGAQVVVRCPYLQLRTPTSITIRWRTDLPTDSRVDYGQGSGALNQSTSVPGSRTEHEVALTGLTPATAYAYAIGDSFGLLVSAPQQRFRTAPDVGTPTPTRVWVLGDCGTGNADARRVRDAYTLFNGARETDVWLMLGYNAYLVGSDAEYQSAVFDTYPLQLASTPLWPALGNHDAASATSTSAGPYFDIFSLPAGGSCGGQPSGEEGYYSFDHANIHFVCLNSAQESSGSSYHLTQQCWLQNDLASTTQEWVVAYWRHPPYSKGSHDSDTETRLLMMRQDYLPILEAAGVDLVLTGHSHSYERSMLIDGHHGLSCTFDPATMAKDSGNGDPFGDGAYRKPSHGLAPNEGAVHIVAGSSGLVSPAPLDHPVMIRNLAVLGSCVLDVYGAQMDVSFLDDGGLIRDHFTIVKGGVTPLPFTRRRVLGSTASLPSISPREGWKYEDSGTDLSAAGWNTLAYDDSLWSEGAAPLGYGEACVATTTASGPAGSVHPTIYFRKSFELNVDPLEVAGFLLRIDYDDGFVAYLNGVEVARSASMPAGAPAHTTLASSHERGVSETHVLAPPAGLLVPGANLLAIEVHQTSNTSSDLYLDARLELYRANDAWRYEDSNTDLGGTDWKLLSFDDTPWSQGPAPLGYGEPNLGTTISPGPSPTNVSPTVYFRRRFTLQEDPASIASLIAAIDYDDGYVLHLNGLEVARSPSMPLGPISHTTLTALPRESGSFDVIDLSAFTSALQPGDNLLAVEVHQFSPVSSDLYLNLVLEIDSVPIPTLDPACATGTLSDALGRPESTLFVNGSDGSLAHSVDLHVGEPITIRLDLPSQNPGPATWALGFTLLPPNPSTMVNLGSIGTFCFDPTSAGSAFLASNIPFLPGLLPPTSLPYTLSLPAGAPVAYTSWMQGLITVPPGVFRTTNAVRVDVLP